MYMYLLVVDNRCVLVY